MIRTREAPAKFHDSVMRREPFGARTYASGIFLASHTDRFVAPPCQLRNGYITLSGLACVPCIMPSRIIRTIWRTQWHRDTTKYCVRSSVTNVLLFEYFESFKRVERFLAKDLEGEIVLILSCDMHKWG